MCARAAKRDHTLDLQKLIDFTKNWRLVLFAGALVLFHLCNASLLPLVSENLAHSRVANSSLFMGGADRGAAGGGRHPGAMDRLLVRTVGPQAAAARRLRHRSGALVA